MKKAIYTIRFLAFVLCITLCTAQFVLPVRVYATEDSSSDDDDSSDDSSSDDSSSDDDSSGGDSSDIDELKKQIEETKAAKQKANEAKSALASGMASVQQIIGSLENEKNNVVTYVATLDAAMEQIQDDLDAIDTAISENKIQIKEAEQAIVDAQAALDEAEAVKQSQYESIKGQIRFMYTTEKNTFLSMILTSKSIADMLNRTHFISLLMAYDQKKLNEYAETVKAAEEAKKLLEESKAKLDEKQAELESKLTEQKSKESDMATLISAKEAEIGQYNTEIGNKEVQVAEYKKMIAEQDAEIAAIEAALKRQQDALAQANKRVYGGGIFVWPAPNYTRISDDFGMRTHPTLGVQMMHNGVDMAAPSGSPILAAADGQVIAASYSSSMGNYVMIDHGSDLITIYMHASSLNVSVGQEVSAGDRIASVGSTGRSTGPHLHFGVRKNGSYVNPWSYLK
ncbi:MAG: peptidoglycan DD-metalloendopeptidase family protein [Lachnospiraceae bacterium]|nr:peptidoglycan DD-metalloendopeptidase family protein [Lachnospiraceae bacterium]